MKYLPFLVLIIVVLGCENNSAVNQPPNANNPVKSLPTVTPLPSYQQKITKSEFGDKWALTVDEGILECQNSEVVFIANGKKYAVNGTAKRNKEYLPVEEIWADDTSIKGAKKNIGFTIEKGLALCE